MKPRRRSLLIGVEFASIAACFLIEAMRDPSSSIETSTRPIVHDAARARPVEAEVDRRNRIDERTPRPLPTTTSGRALDTDDLPVAAFLSKVAPSARRGDAVAAYRMYQAEAMCASIDWQARMEWSDVDDRAQWATRLSDMTEACADVTPAQVGERFNFLDQAIRAGNPEAMIDYRREGPNGQGDLDAIDPRDPLVVTWKQNAGTYLRQLAADGNRDAWALLAQDCESGLVVDRDLASAITYWAALQISRRPTVDPLSIDFIDAMARQLSPADARRAIEAGRALGMRFPYRRPSG